jgi:hypothetical protein
MQRLSHEDRAGAPAMEAAEDINALQLHVALYRDRKVGWPDKRETHGRAARQSLGDECPAPAGQ